MHNSFAAIIKQLLNITKHMKKSAAEWSLKAAINNCEETSMKDKIISSRYRETNFTFKNNDTIQGSINTFIAPCMEISRMNLISSEALNVQQENIQERYVSTFVYSGNIQSHFINTDKAFTQNKQQHSFVHSKTVASKHIIAAGNTSLLYINLKPSLLESYIPGWEKYSDETYNKKDEPFYVSPSLEIKRNQKLQQVLLSMYSTIYNEATRAMYLEAKAMEVIALQFEELLNIQNSSSLANDIIRKPDRENLEAVYEYININYLEPLSLNMLSKKFLLNEFKLKKGFRQLYKYSVFNYIHTLRMNKAKELLLESSMPVTEVSDMVGYSSVHNFSNAFYKTHGYRPSVLKN